MRPRHAVLLTPSKPSRLFRPSCGADHTLFPYLVTSLLPCSSSLSSLDATFMDLPASVASKGLTAELNPLDATFTKNRGWGAPPFDVLTPIPANVSNGFPIYPLCFHTLAALTGSMALEQLFSNQPVTHSFRRDGGCTPLPSSPYLFRLPLSSHQSRVTSHQSRATSHESPVTSHQSRATAHIPLSTTGQSTTPSLMYIVPGAILPSLRPGDRPLPLSWSPS